MKKRRIFGELSPLGIAASVFAATTAAYVASLLGVSGTVIGAAVASFTATITAAVYTHLLNRSSEIATRKSVEPQNQIADDEGMALPPEEVPSDKIHWKSVIVTAVIVLGITIGVILGYEAFTGQGFGPRDDQPPVIGGSSEVTPSPVPSSNQTPTPDGSPSPSPSPSMDASPEPSPMPTPEPDTSPAP